MGYSAKDIIEGRDIERSKQAPFLTLWQDAADLMYSTQNTITTTGSPGQDLSLNRYEDTGALASQHMAAGLSSLTIPVGQAFFAFQPQPFAWEENQVPERALRWAWYAAEQLHRDMFASNFMTQYHETLRSLCVFGTNYLMSEWGSEVGGLNYRDYPIWTGQIKENSKGDVDTMYLTLTYSARQAIQEFGYDNVTQEVREAVEKPQTESRKFDFIFYVGPRTAYMPGRRDAANYPWQWCYVDEKARAVVKDGGFEEFPWHVCRWMKRTGEKYGRGQGTEILATVRMFQKVWKDFVDLCNRYGVPPLEVLQSYDGKVKLYPGAVNKVPQIGTIRGVEQQVLGNFPATKDMVLILEQRIREAFFEDIFRQLANLTGDRRTTTEIIERVQEGLTMLGPPAARLNSELLSTVVMRSLLLEMRHGRIEPAPPEMAGRELSVEFVGKLTLALGNQQARSFIQFAQLSGEMEAAGYVGCTDWVNADSAFPFMATALGMRPQDIATQAQVEAKRQQRAAAQQAAMAAEAAKAAARSYKDASVAPAPGSPSAALMEVA